MLKNPFKNKVLSLKRIQSGEAFTLDSLFDRHPGGKVYETHYDNIYKALVFVLPGCDFDTSTGWQDAKTRDEAGRIAREMTGYVGEDRAFWRAVAHERGEVLAYVLTSAVAGGRAVLREGTLFMDASLFQYYHEPESGRGGP